MSNMTMQFSQQTRKLFIQMSGAPGSGKSTTANPLAKLINGVVVDHDILKSALLEKGVSFDKAAEIAYHLNWTFAEALIKQEHSVIVDSTCNCEQILSQGIALAQRYGYEYWYVEVKADNVSMLDERLRERVPLRSQRTGVHCPPRDAGGARGSEDSHALFKLKRWIENPCRPDGHDNRTVVVNSTDSPEMRLIDIMKQIFSPTCTKANILAIPKSSLREGGSDVSNPP